MLKSVGLEFLGVDSRPMGRRRYCCGVGWSSARISLQTAAAQYDPCASRHPAVSRVLDESEGLLVLYSVFHEAHYAQQRDKTVLRSWQIRLAAGGSVKALDGVEFLGNRAVVNGGAVFCPYAQMSKCIALGGCVTTGTGNKNIRNACNPLI